jgi:hypothetical protein
MFALMCSDASMRSRNVKQEVLLAWKYEKPYLPLLLSPVSFPEQVQYWLEGFQWIEIFNHPSEVWLPELQQALSIAARTMAPPNASLPDKQPQPTPRGLGAAQANLWQRKNLDPPEMPVNPASAASSLAGLYSLASFTDRIWPIPAEYARADSIGKTFRGLGAPQDHVKHGHRIGSRISLAIESDRAGHLLLLDEGPEEIVYSLCPSHFAPDTRLRTGRNYLPQPGSAYESFVVSGRPGRELLLAIITREPLGFEWLPRAPRTPAHVLNQADLDGLLSRLRELDVREWTALATHFEIIDRL